MLYQSLSTDITTISKSAKGRVLFYNLNGDCVLGISEQEDVQLHFLENYIYMIQAGAGTIPFDAQNESTYTPVNGSLYKFTVWGLTDIDGRPFTAIDEVTGNFEEYKEKVREVYEYLVANVFVGCCGTSTNSVLWYADEASFPVTGLTETLYVDMATPALFLWDGAAYVAFGGGSGGGVESVTGDSVDNTDPFNPIVNAIPLAGTVSGSPVTGDVEVTGGVAMFVENSGIARVLWDDGNVGLEASALDGSLLTSFTVIAGAMSATSDEPNFAGIVYSTDYSANFNNLSLINQLVMKSRIWTKAGTPTTTDDSSQGYIVGSLIWDTTNSILYRCTSNTATAATWVVAIESPTYLELIRTGAVIPSSSSRYATEGFAGLGTGIIVTICPKSLFTTFRSFITTAQPASGSLIIYRKFYDVAAAEIGSQALTIPAGSAAGIYEYTGSTYDMSSTNGSYGFTITNNATSSSGNLNSIESVYQ